MINQVEQKTKAHHYPIVSLESGGMIGVVASTNYPVTNTVQRLPQNGLTMSFVCLGLGAVLGATGASMLVANEITKVQTSAKIQVLKAQDVAAIAQWNQQKQQQQVDDFCSKNRGQVNGKN